MKNNEKSKTKNNAKIRKETEKIKELIRKETGIYIKKMKKIINIIKDDMPNWGILREKR